MNGSSNKCKIVGGIHIFTTIKLLPVNSYATTFITVGRLLYCVSLRRFIPATFPSLRCRAPLAARASGEFHHGVNLSHWFDYEGRCSVGATENSAPGRVGFDHVRIPVDPSFMGWSPRQTPEILGPGPLNQAIAQALAARLDVIVHVSPDETTKALIENEAAVFKSCGEMPANLTRPLARLPRNRVALELRDEPQFYGWRGGRWQLMRAQLIASVRKVAPELTLIGMGKKGGSLEGLADLESYL